MVEVSSSFRIEIIVVVVIIMICRSLAESTGHFWWSAEFKNVENPDFENLNHLQNPGHLSMTDPNTYLIVVFKKKGIKNNSSPKENY